MSKKPKSSKRTKKQPKDISVLETFLGKLIFDASLRSRFFRNPEKVANELGVRKCVADSILTIGKEGINEFCKKYEREILKASSIIIFCV